MPPHPEPFFLQVDDGPLGQRFVLYHAPRRGARGLVVHVHPFAEEMNKSRRMAALQSRALAHDGFAVLQIDLLGCGDSAGDFGDATWTQWVTDVVFACRWLQQRHAGAAMQLWLWGHRAGALLAVQAAQQLATPSNLLLWQPTIAGKTVLQQFLRLKVAGNMMGGQAKAAMAQMRNTLAAGQAVDVAGYTLHPALCNGLERALLQPPRSPVGRVEWFEISPQDDASLSPAATSQAQQWRLAGWAVRTHLVRGPAFWQNAEIEDAPVLLQATLEALNSPGAISSAPTAAALRA